jgi:hypothetical protein
MPKKDEIKKHIIMCDNCIINVDRKQVEDVIFKKQFLLCIHKYLEEKQRLQNKKK